MTDPAKQKDQARPQRDAEIQSPPGDLTGLNHTATGHELRLLSLEQEVNQLCQRHGEALRYPLNFAPNTTPRQTESPGPVPGDSLLPLPQVQTRVQTQLQTQELQKLRADFCESELRYRALFNSLDAGFCIIEKIEAGTGKPLDFRYVEANPAFAAQSGVSDVIGKTILQLFEGEAEEWILIYDAVCKTGEPIRFERQLVGQGRMLELYAFRVEGFAQCRVAINFQDITERQQAKETLRQSIVQFETLINEAPLGVVLIDADFRVRQVNPSALPAYGNMPGLIGRDYAEVLHILWPKAQADAAIQQLRHTLETGEPCFVPEMIEKRADRQTTEYYEWHINRIPLPDGSYGVVCYFRDISERVLAQQKIRDSEERYRGLFNSIDEGSAILEIIFDDKEQAVDYRFLEVNPAFEKQTGIPNATGKRIREITADHEAPAIEIYSQVLLTGEPVRFINETKPLGRYFDVYAVRLGKPENRKIAIVFNNVTEHKEAGEALRVSEQRFRALVTASTDMAYCMSPDWREIRQLDGKKFIADVPGPGGNWIQEYLDPEDQPQVLAVINEAIQTKSLFELEHRIRRVDGSLGWTISRAVPLVDERGEIVEWFGTATDVTERKQAAQALRESEDRYRRLFNSIDEGFCLIEMVFNQHDKAIDYRFLEVNPAFEQQTGLHDAAGKRILELVPDHDEEWFEVYGKVALTGEATRFVSQAQAMDGRWFDVYAAPLGGRDSRKVALLFRNITERKNAEGALRESEERYRNLFNSMDEGFCIIEMIFDAQEKPVDYRFLEVNPAFEKQSGMDGVTGKRVREIIPNLEEYWFEIYGQVALTGKPVRFVNEVKALERWLDIYAARLGGPKNRQVAIIFSNITERTKSDRALRQSEARFRALFDTGPIAIYSCDTFGVIQEYNACAVKLWGQEPKPGDTFECFRSSLKFYLPDDTLQGISQGPMAQVLKGDLASVNNQEYIIERADSSRVTIIANVVPLNNELGQITGGMCCFYDITERSRLEHKTLEQAQALADLDRRKDEFLAMLSHELRNPLAAIFNAVQLLRLQKNEAPLQQQGRNIIERQVGQLKHLVDDLLEVSRITSGSVRLRQEQVSLSGVVERAVETTQPLIAQRRHALTVSLPSQPVFLYADAARLEQVLVNLLTNAAKYTDEGGRIWLSLEQDKNMAVLRVRDTGIGIAPELLPRIFELFTQAERSLDRAQGGLGIGLCLVQRLVELHGGSVEAHSVLGQGSEFVVRLPVMLTALSAAPALDTAPSPDQAATGYRVLVVDDNVDAAQSLATLLEMTGHQVRLAYDGPSAVEAAIDYQPDVVLLDIGLPGLDGFEVAQQIRQQDSLKHIVLAALTGYGQDTDRQRSQDAGFDYHLVKPVDFDEVEKILLTASHKVSS